MTHPRSIVVLDDDFDLREEICHALAADGHDVVGIGNANALANTRADVLVLDLALPGIDGVDVLRRLAKQHASAPGIVLISGYGESVLRTASRSAEAGGLTVLGVMPKPIDPDLLSAVVRRDIVGPRKVLESVSDDLVPHLGRALSEDNVAVHFQPKVRTETLTFAGAEALLAGHLGDDRRASPPKIIEAARRMPDGLTRLTHSVLHQASQAAQRWTDAGFAGPVSVNLPMEALLAPDSVATLSALATENGLDPSQVTFELLEDALYDSSAEALALLTKLRLAGFGLALDDLGQRQSGLLQLANLPVTEIKIDLEIVRQARTWEKARNIFGSLAELGHRLGISVTAEGVETFADLEFVRSHPVDYFQGYLVSGKRPIEDFLGKLPLLAPESEVTRYVAA